MEFLTSSSTRELFLYESFPSGQAIHNPSSGFTLFHRSAGGSKDSEEGDFKLLNINTNNASFANEEGTTHSLELKDTHSVFWGGNTECKQNFCLFSQKLHRAPF